MIMLLVTSSHDYFQNLVYSHWLGCIFFSFLFSVAGRSLSILLEACCFCLFLVLQVVFVLMSRGFSFINSSVSHSLQLGRLFQMLEGLGSRMEKDGLLDKYSKPELNAVYVEDWSNLTKKFLKALPYSLTSSQLSASSQIIWDLKRPVPMNRLLQVLDFIWLVVLSLKTM